MGFEVKMSVRRAVPFLMAPLMLLAPAHSWAQGAWTPAKGEFFFTPSYQYLDGGDHLFSQPRGDLGKAFDVGLIQSNAMVLDGDIGITDKLAVNAAVVLVNTRYVVGPRGFGTHSSEADDGRWNTGFQDGRIGAQYMAFNNGTVALTPAISWGFPTTAYNTAGHAALGTGIKELRMGLEWGLNFARLPRAIFTGAASYAFMDNPAEIPIDRTNVMVGFAYFLPWFDLQGWTEYQAIHGGLDWLGDLAHLPTDHPDREHNFFNHDRASDADFWRIGGGIAVPIGTKLEAFGNVATSVWGINTVRATTVTIGVTYRVRLFGGTQWW